MSKVYIVNKKFLLILGAIILFTLIAFTINDRVHHDKVYGSCALAAKAEKVNIVKGQEGYSLALDADKDGVACEEK